MRDLGAIVAPAFDVQAVLKAVRQTHIQLLDAERAEKADAARAERSRDVAARLRLDMGRALMEARKAWPARGPKAKGWGDFLRDAGIGEDSALRWMALAGYVAERVSRTDSGVREISDTQPEVSEISTRIPTYAEAGIKPRPVPVEPVEAPAAAPVVALAPPPAPLPVEVYHDPALDEIGRVAEDVKNKANALQSAVQRLTGLLRQHDATVSGPEAALVRAAIVRARGLIGECYQLTARGTNDQGE